MAKYRRAEQEEDNELTYAEEMAAQTQAQDQEPPAEGEDTTYKKRYGDLRRHTQQIMQQKDQALEQMKAQLDQAAKGQIKFPKTDEEIEILKQAAAMVDGVYLDIAKAIRPGAR